MTSLFIESSISYHEILGKLLFLKSIEMFTIIYNFKSEY